MYGRNTAPNSLIKLVLRLRPPWEAASYNGLTAADHSVSNTQIYDFKCPNKFCSTLQLHKTEFQTVWKADVMRNQFIHCFFTHFLLFYQLNVHIVVQTQVSLVIYLCVINFLMRGWKAEENKSTEIWRDRADWFAEGRQENDWTRVMTTELSLTVWPSGSHVKNRLHHIQNKNKLFFNTKYHFCKWWLNFRSHRIYSVTGKRYRIWTENELLYTRFHLPNKMLACGCECACDYLPSPLCTWCTCMRMLINWLILDWLIHQCIDIIVHRSKTNNFITDFYSY